METIKLLKTRQSNRSFLSDAIDSKIIEDIVDCARFYPSGYNFQPLKFIVINDRQLLTEFSKICKYGRFFKDCSHAIAIISRKTPFNLEDASAATQNILLAATAYNLGSCWVGCNKQPHNEEVCKLLNVPEKYELLSMVAIGKINKDEKRPLRKDLNSILSYNKFN